MRMLEVGTIFAWFIATAMLAVVAVEVVNRWLEPDLHVSSVERSTDPRTVARQISARMAVDSSATQTVENGPTSFAGDDDYTLIGVATGFGNAPGFAMLRTASGQLHSVTVGENLPSGARLLAIRPDHIELDQRGAVKIIRIAREELQGITPSPRSVDDSQTPI